MPRLLTVGMLVVLLWPWAAPSDAQAQGPGPRARRIFLAPALEWRPEV